MAKILIVEDEGILAMTMEMTLSAMGHHVVGIADNGNRAIELAVAHRPDLILMDIILKGSLDGIATTNLICSRFPDCQVIYITAHTDAKTIAAAQTTRHMGFFHKPFEPYQLEEYLNSVL